jgi:site-specific DNA recombinase
MAKRFPFKLTQPVPTARVAIYCRLASVESIAPFQGLIEQEKAVRESIDYRNSLGLSIYKVEGVYQDHGSGVSMCRPELQRLLADVKAKKVDAVFVFDIARLSRSMRDFSEIWHALRSSQCRLVSVQESFDTNQWLLATLEKELCHA